MAPDPQHCLVIISIGSRRISATVAWMRPQQGEQITAHRSMQCRWAELSDSARSEAIADVLEMARSSAGVEPYSVFVSMSDASLRANFAHGYVDLGHPMAFTREDRDLALVRASKQAIGTNRKDLHAIQPLWVIRDENGDHDCDDPVGLRGVVLRCSVLLVTADRDNYDYMETLLRSNGIALEGMIAPPVALYRAVQGGLPKRGSTILIDMGARHTSIMVHRKNRLIHLETNEFGGDDLTEAIADQLKIPLERAEALKCQMDLGVHGNADEGKDAGQTYIWRDVQENSRHLGPAAMVCASLLRQFLRARCTYLKDNELLSHTGRIHCFGRGAALGGLPALVREVFAMEAVLGTKQADRDPSNEIGSVITVGLVRAAAEERKRQIAQRRASSGFRQVASAAGGIWGWLATPLHG